MSDRTAHKGEGTEDQTKTLRVYEALRRRIRELDLAPGTRLRKNDLADEFGVSRAPVSEALAKLAEEGLVEIYRQSGTYVAPIRDQDIRDSMIIRTALEVETARRVTADLTEADFARLAENLALQEEALAAENLTWLDELDAAFHTIIVDALDCPRLRAQLDSCRARLDRQRFRGLRTKERPQDTVNEHRRIYEAMRSRDVDYAAAAMRAHLNYVSNALQQSLSEGGES